MPRAYTPDSAAPYEIRVAGCLQAYWTEWFGGLALSDGGDGSAVLRGTVADQAALHGVLAQIRDLNLVLLAVRRIDTD